MVTHLNAVTWADLELPLSWHDLGVGTGDLDAGVQASLIVSLNDVTAKDLSSADTAVVWTLWSWVAVHWPSVWTVRHVEESVLLLETEPWLLGLMSLHELGSLIAVVELVWSSVRIPALAENENVWVTTEWIWEDRNRAKVEIRRLSWSLSGRGTVKVPLWKILELHLAIFWDLEDGLYHEIRLANMFCKCISVTKIST